MNTLKGYRPIVSVCMLEDISVYVITGRFILVFDVVCFENLASVGTSFVVTLSGDPVSK